MTMIQRDAYIQSAAMLGGKGSDTSRFEQVCIYISGITQLTAKEAISVVSGLILEPTLFHFVVRVEPM